MRNWTVLLGVLLVGCAPMQYTPPPPLADEEPHIQVIARPYDDVWDDLIEYAAQNFFQITTLEKDSGIISASYRTDRPAEYIDCGQYETKVIDALTKERKVKRGAYTDKIAQDDWATLSGQINIAVKAVDEQNTRVRVQARYIFSDWLFDSGGSASLVRRSWDRTDEAGAGSDWTCEGPAEELLYIIEPPGSRVAGGDFLAGVPSAFIVLLA